MTGYRIITRARKLKRRIRRIRDVAVVGVGDGVGVCMMG